MRRALWALALSALLLSGECVASAPSPSSTSETPAVTPRFRRYSVKDGLPSDAVYVARQDPHGFIWIGTRDGLARFDGQHFVVFRHHPDHPASIGGNDVSVVLVDHQGHIWAGGEASGVNLYQPDRQAFRHWRHKAGDPSSLSSDDILAMAQTDDGSIWVGTYAGGLNRMRADRSGFDHLREGKGAIAGLSLNTVTALAAGPDDSLWIGTPSGAARRDREGHLHRVKFCGFPGHHVFVLAIDGPAGHPLISTNLGTFRVDAGLAAHQVVPGDGKGRFTTGAAEDAHGNLWVASLHGLYWRSHDGRVQHILARPHWRGRLSDNGVNAVTLDRHGGLWVATRGGGLFYQAAAWGRMRYFSPDENASGHVPSSKVQALVRDARGRLLIGGHDFLERLDPQSGRIKDLTPVLKGAREITGLVRIGHGDIAVSTEHGICILRGTACRPRRLRSHRQGVRRLVALPDGSLYFEHGMGDAYMLPPERGAPRHLTLANNGVDGRQTTQMSAAGGRLYRASHAGLSVLDAKTRHFGFLPGVAHGWVQAFTFAGPALWLARRTSLDEYRRRGGTWHRVRSVAADGGWPGPQVVAMHVDESGRVWLFDVSGILRFDPRNGRFQNFDRISAEPGTEFTSQDIVDGNAGMIYTGTARGVLGFRPAQMTVRPQPPRPVIDAVTVRRGDRVVNLPVDARTLRLHWNDHDFSVVASAPTFVDPDHTRFRFRLNGFDHGWVKTGYRGTRELTGLGSGDYTLDIQATGPFGHHGSLRPPLHIVVAPPWWNTHWAWAVYVVLAIALWWMGHRMWRQRLEQRHRMRLAEQQRSLAEQASAAKSQFLATLGHEIRTPMTGVLGMTELLRESHLGARERDYVEAIERSGTMLLKLVNDALDLARIEARRLDLDQAPFDPKRLVKDVVQLDAGLAARKQLELRTDVADNVPPCVRGDAIRVKQVLLNLVGNAIKFTERGHVTVRLGYDGTDLVFEIEDTGPGIPEGSRGRLFQRFEQNDGPQRDAGSGLGLAICRELVALMGGRIELFSRDGEGSRFEVRLPLPRCEQAEEGEPPVPTAGRRWRLLLVEDDVTVADVICELLRGYGHEVVHHLNALTALAELDEGGFDAAVLDLDLPGVDGFDLMRLVRRQKSRTQLPIVAVTARSGGDDQQRAMAAGADGFLRKPVSGRDLQAELGRVIRHQ